MSFHRALKYSYLQKKPNRRVDKCIHILLKITHDKEFERAIKLTRGKRSKRLTEIWKRHIKSKGISLLAVKALEVGKWEVKTKSDITAEHDQCPVRHM